MVKTKKIYLSEKNKVFLGVCGGIAERYDIDPLWLRLIFVLLALNGGIGIVLYLVAWIVIPEPQGVKKDSGAQKLKTSNEPKRITKTVKPKKK